MGERFGVPPSSDDSWKLRGAAENQYRVRRLSHDANTSIEYGEKTWTTAQTVRDLMQNHLDAETDRYYQHIAKTIFDEEALTRYFSSDEDSAERKKAEDLLFAAFRFAKYAEDMTPEARGQSEAHLQTIAEGLTVKDALLREHVFSPPLLLEGLQSISEERPHVSYNVLDTETNSSAGWIPYETLRDEPLYQSKKIIAFAIKSER